MFTDKTRAAIYSVAFAISQDAGESSPIELAELVCDGYRLTTQGYPEADKEVWDLVKKHNWIKVRNAAARLF